MDVVGTDDTGYLRSHPSQLRAEPSLPARTRPAAHEARAESSQLAPSAPRVRYGAPIRVGRLGPVRPLLLVLCSLLPRLCREMSRWHTRCC